MLINTNESNGLNGRLLVALFMAILLLVGSNMKASNSNVKQPVPNIVKLAGTSWTGLAKSTLTESGTSVGFIVNMTIEFVNKTDANMSMDVLTEVSGIETIAQKDIKGKLKYTFDGKSKGTMNLKQLDILKGAVAKRPFTFTYNDNGTITLDCWIYEDMGITSYELKKIAPKDENTTTAESKPIDTIGTNILDEEVFSVVEQMPSFPGGEAQMMAYISKNLKYPEIAYKSGIQGRVFVKFVVERDGSITNVVVQRGIGGGCDEEAVRVIQSMPKWNPGKQKGETVRVSYMVPIFFKL